jgi:hypothetical protein
MRNWNALFCNMRAIIDDAGFQQDGIAFGLMSGAAVYQV